MLLERDDICSELDTLADEAFAGRGCVAFVVGEAGIGKTTVLRATASRLAQRARVLWAACEDLSASEALTLLRELTLVDRDALDHASDSGSRLSLFGDTLALLASEPTVLMVEDLHWADDGSIDFVRYVGRRIASLPLLLVASSRNEDQGARARLVRAANDLPPAVRRRYDLPRLSSAAVGKLAAAHGLIGSAIHEVTGGNPLLVTEILAAGGRRSTSIDDLVIARADALEPAARDFLDYCSIIPRRVGLDQIVAAGASEATIAACTDSSLLLADGDGLAFRHEITRHAVEQALSPLRRALLHMRELARLAAAGASAARRLHHAIGAKDRARIAELAPAAARQAAALGAHGEAVNAWAALLEDAPAPLDPAQCEQYAFELHLTGNVMHAIAWQRRALDIHAARGDRLRQGDNLRFLSRLHYMMGERSLAEAAAREAIPLLEPFPESPELALGYANIAHLAMLADDHEEAIRRSEQAIPIVEQLGRDDILATVLNNYGTSMQYDDMERSIAVLDRSIALGKSSGSEEHVARSYTNKGWTLLQARRLGEALDVQREGIAYCIERELYPWADYMSGGAALALLALGRWDEAEDFALPVVEKRGNTHLMRNPSVRALALLRIRRGAEGWQPLVEELGVHMDKGREPPRFTGLALIRAEQAWTAGAERDGALALLAEAVAFAGDRGCPWDRCALWAWQRRLGQDLPLPDNAPSPFRLLAAGDRPGAAVAFRALDMPFEEALELGGGSEEQVADALAILGRLGANATAARLRADLGNRGLRRGARGPRASTRANGFGLTRRELDVLRAIDKGWTNKEIGERLFVSAKTVDHHVSAILGKLHARTRGEAAASAREHGLIG